MAIPFRFLTGVASLILCSGALAQGDDGAQPGEEDPAVLQPIAVTGYHIKRIDTQGPAPVVVFSRSDLEQAGINTLEEFARYLPLNWTGPTLRFATVGAASFDLRGIGVDATLTLVNGLRVAPYAQSAENYIDVNAIPVSAIERIEILKDGASAIYGADAIAGVVNIILREGYDGVEVSAGYSVSKEGDGDEFLADIVMGRDTGRGSILFSLSWYDRDPQPMANRDWSANADWSSIGGPNRRSSFGSPPTMFRHDSYSLEHDPECGTDPLVSSVRNAPSGGTVCGFNFPRYQDQFPGLERIGAGLSGRYQVKAGLSLFGDALYSDSKGTARQAPQGISGSPALETIIGVPFVPADHPGNPFGVPGELLSRVLNGGERVHENQASAYRVVLGLEGLWDQWDWRLTGLTSRNRVEKTFRNLVSRSRYQQALLGLGGPGENQWYDPFGFEPVNDPALVDWLTTDAVQRDKTRESSVDLLFSRELGSLPGGPAAVALGLQYREQKLEQWAEEALLSGDLGHTHEPVTADRDIGAAWFEFGLPVLAGLEAQLALRYEDYSDFGTTTNPKMALRWQPLESLMFRASYGTSFKPPSFYELYQPQMQDFWRYRDVERCEWTGSDEDCKARSYPVQWGGNADLDPEKGKSWFAGTVWTPGFLPGFELQLDFWSFKTRDRIEWLDAQLVLDQKGDHGIVRAPMEPDGTPGRILLIREGPVNAERLETNGFDTTLSYSRQTERYGVFRASLLHSYIDRWEFTESLGSGTVNKNYAGDHRRIAIPRSRANMNFSWNRGPHGLAANIHYTGHYRNHTDLYVDGEETDQPMIISSHTTLDLQYSYTFRNLRNAILRLGCNNVFDKDPPLNYGALEPFHDGRGRFFYLRWQQPIR